MKPEFLKHGSAKDLYDAGLGLLNFVFTDGFSAFDVGTCPQPIPGKAQALCAAAVQSFWLARALGITTHFIKQVNAFTIQVRRVQVISDRSLTGQDTDCVVPAEWIDRQYLSGSLLREFKSGRKKPTAYGFPTDQVPVEGTPLPWPVCHFTTKFEDTDRDLTRAQAREMCGMTEDDEAQFWAMGNVLNGAMAAVWQQAGFVRFDGKKEFLLIGPARQKVVGDVFGTQDEDRPVLLLALKRGHIEHYSKEYVRQYLINCGYYAEVQAARKAGQPDPPYPLIPKKVIAEMARRYAVFADAYCRIVI